MSVVHATFDAWLTFTVPIDIADRNWYIKWGKLHVELPDGSRQVYLPSETPEDACDFSRPRECTVERIAPNEGGAKIDKSPDLMCSARRAFLRQSLQGA